MKIYWLIGKWNADGRLNLFKLDLVILSILILNVDSRVNPNVDSRKGTVLSFRTVLTQIKEESVAITLEITIFVLKRVYKLNIHDDFSLLHWKIIFYRCAWNGYVSKRDLLKWGWYEKQNIYNPIPVQFWFL